MSVHTFVGEYASGVDQFVLSLLSCIDAQPVPASAQLSVSVTDGLFVYPAPLLIARLPAGGMLSIPYTAVLAASLFPAWSTAKY
jgi:hypothetical protein